MKKNSFLCVANLGRSQMAEGIAKHLLDGRGFIYKAPN